ncbi:FAR1-related sequence 5-like protein isoform X2 [Tanacetum coccineum]
MSQGIGSTGLNHGMEATPSGSSGTTTRNKKRKNTCTNDDSQACSSALDEHDKGDLFPWVLYVGKDKHTQNWVVKTHRDTHKCLQSREIKHCTYKFLSEKIYNQVRVNPEIPVKVVQDQLQRDLERSIFMSKAFRAKAKSTNPNTTVKIAVERNNDPFLPTMVLQRIYVCLGALKLGFRACKRDMLGLDGAFMKGLFPGQVLAVVGHDSNNEIYPLAYALVEAESKSSWCWFLQCLGDDIDLHPNSNFTFINDRQKVGRPKKKRKRSKNEDEPFVKDGGNNAEANGLFVADCAGGAGVGVGVGSQGSFHTIWTKRRVQTVIISPQKQLPLNLQVNPFKTVSQRWLSDEKRRNAEWKEMSEWYTNIVKCNRWCK